MKLGLTTAVLACGAIVAACASRPPPPVATVTTTSAEPASVACEMECEGVEVVAQPARTESPDYHAAAVADANRVVAGMHDDLLVCYKRRLATHPRAHGSITFDIVIGPDGRVRTVDTTGGALLGDAAMRCMSGRIERATFAPVHGGGTLRIHVPFILRATPTDESI